MCDSDRHVLMHAGAATPRVAEDASMNGESLRGERVHLVPTLPEHGPALEALAKDDPESFQYMSSSPLDHGGRAYVEEILASQDRGQSIAFTVVDATTLAPVGSTRFGDIDSGHPRCEIGWTWLAPSHRGGHVNAEMKLLMVEHAFTVLNCERVAIKTDARNLRAQRAIEGLGATREGVLRRHMRLNDGYVRDTVYYSIIRSEWKDVRKHLMQKAYGNRACEAAAVSGTKQMTVVALTESRLPDLTEVLTSCRWEFFVDPVHSPESVRKLWEDGDLSAPDNAGFLIESGDCVVGLIRLHDLQDDTPIFDVRLREAARGRGLGTAAVEWVIRHFFVTENRIRIEAQTRSDNLAMRATLRKAGFVKEAHYRSADRGGHDWVAYGLLRLDWETGTTTPVPWHDE